MERIIFHIDCNAFFASVEETVNPHLKAVPMAVCGDPESRRGIILAKNQLAKNFGVQTAETIWQAKKKCPELVLAPARRGMYRDFCEKINKIYLEYTDLVEQAGIDESFLDITGTLHLFKKTPLELANEIRERVKREQGLTVSVGVSYNKIFAKLGSDYKKPDAVTVIARDNFKDLLWPLHCSNMLMVGESTRAILERMSLSTIGDIACAPTEYLQANLGKTGLYLHKYCNGLDDSPVIPEDERERAQSIGSGMTFKRNLMTEEDIRTALTVLSQEVSARLRSHGFRCTSLNVTIKDENLKTITRQKPVTPPSRLWHELTEVAMALVTANWRVGKPIRMLTITAQKLVDENDFVLQTSLFDEPEEVNEKKERLEEAAVAIREKYGKKSLNPGSVIKNDLGI